VHINWKHHTAVKTYDYPLTIPSLFLGCLYTGHFCCFSLLALFSIPQRHEHGMHLDCALWYVQFLHSGRLAP